jgi:hypothetical protein
MSVLAVASPLAGEVVITLAVLFVDLVAVVRVVRLPRDRFRHGGWSKAGWVVLALGFTWTLGTLPVPVGALLALRRTRRSKPGAGRTGPANIPFAEGAPVGGKEDRS